MLITVCSEILHLKDELTPIITTGFMSIFSLFTFERLRSPGSRWGRLKLLNDSSAPKVPAGADHYAHECFNVIPVEGNRALSASLCTPIFGVVSFARLLGVDTIDTRTRGVSQPIDKVQ